jgi:hypothetical protein
VDARRFELLLDLERSKIPLNDEASMLLRAIRQRHPKWRDAEPEKVGFTVWHGTVTNVVGDKDRLESVAGDRLLQAAKAAADATDFLEGDAWQALCQADPSKAFSGIESAPATDRWQEWAWRPFLWASAGITDPNELNRIARLLVQWPSSEPFEETASGAAWWMNEVSEKLKAPLLWAVWDLIERRASRHVEVLNNNPLQTALNNPVGHLASVLLKRTKRAKGSSELGKQLRARYERLIGSDDTFALLARVRLSAAIAFLFERAPKWATAMILPSFSWVSTDAPAMWSARTYSTHIGSAELFRLTKDSFLELFSRPEISDESVRVFSDWLALILMTNQVGKADYPLTAPEVRSVLRRAGHQGLSSFAHRLSMEMESAKPEEKDKVWRERVGPVFHAAWPLDVELQTSSVTFSLVQILLATGSAFAEAATMLLPFIRAEDPRLQTSIFSISEANAYLYHIAPQKMLDLLSAVAGDAPERTLYGLDKALNILKGEAPELGHTKQFQKLVAQASPY